MNGILFPLIGTAHLRALRVLCVKKVRSNLEMPD